MNDQIREQLIGYVLGALDEHEHRSVEEQLANDPRWRDELAAVQEYLEPMAEAYTEYEPPADLAARTCRYVREECERLRVTRPQKPAMSSDGRCEWRHSGRFADWVVVAGVCLIAVALFFPALLQSRVASHITVCQNNLRELGIMLTQFSNATQDRLFPPVATEGNRAFAGIYGPVLKDAGLLLNSRLVVCPESPVARELGENFRVPSCAQVDAAGGHDIHVLQRTAGGTYAYTLGFTCNGRHIPARNLNRGYFIVMADAPIANVGRLAAHGKVFNALYEDGHVQLLNHSVRERNTGIIDDPFHNRLGFPEAGTDIEDAVVGSSCCPPLLRTSAR